MRCRDTVKIVQTSCKQRGNAYVESGRNLGMLAPVPMAHIFSKMVSLIAEDARGYVPLSIFQNIGFASLYLLRSCQVLMDFDDWNIEHDDRNRAVLLPVFGNLREVFSGSIFSIDYGDLRDVVEGILESLEERLCDDDRQCLQRLHIYVHLVLIYISKVDQEISEVMASLRSICVSGGGCE